MEKYKLPVCFWCGAGLNTVPCKMAQAFNETHDQQKYFSTDLPKERLDKRAKKLNDEEIKLCYSKR